MEQSPDAINVLNAKRRAQALSLAIGDITSITIDYNDTTPPKYYLRVTSLTSLEADDSMRILDAAQPTDVVFEVERHPDITGFERKHQDVD